MSILELKRTSLPSIPEENLSDVPLACSVEMISATTAASSSTNLAVCRICHVDHVSGERLISPCRCKGSLGWVHLSCLEKWLNQSCRTNCELCGFKYNSTQTPRYTILEGVRIWIREPGNKAHMQADLLIAVLLSFVTAALLTVSVIGMDQFIMEGQRLGVSKVWTKAGLFMFLTMIVSGYCITIYLLMRDQYLPWYRWWTRTLDVRLHLDPPVNAAENL